jgi:hypothetical protein
MTSYRAQVETSADGQIWQATDAPEIVDIADSQPADRFDAREAAQEAGAVPGTHVRILVWPGDYDGYGTTQGTVYVAEHTVPSAYTWQQISKQTGYSEDEIYALTAEWIGEPGYLDEDDQPTQATLDLLLEQRSTEKPSYEISRDGLADLALSIDLEQQLADALDDEDGTHVRGAIEDAINAKLTEHGVSSTGEWLGDWSAADVVTEVLRARDDLTELGAARRAAILEGEFRTDLLRQAVVRAMAKPGANESAITRQAGVDRMTVRKWAGK